jgi:Leucine rich repeat/Leucine Rich repeat
MIPPPTPSSGPAAINTDELQAWIVSRRRSRNRLKLIGLTVLVLGVGGIAVVWTFFHEQFLAEGHLRGLGCKVEWEVTRENLFRGGTTTVSYAHHWNGLFNDITGKDLESLRSLRHLISLDMSSIPVRDEDLGVLAHLSELQDLSLDRASDSYNSPRAVRNIGRLTDRTLVYLQGLKSLNILELGGNAFTDAGLANLKDLKALKSLGLAKNPITDAGLKHLANLQSLQSLDLDGTEVTDAGLDALKGLKSLKILRVENTAVTLEGVVKFQGVRSDVEVIREPAPNIY